MCRTVHALLQTAICGIQMLVRVFMTVILMIENVIRMLLQTLYNFISFMLQMISLVPICLVFLATARLKCFMCGGGGPCPVARGGACDCLMSAVAIFILALIFRATGTLDKIFFGLGYAKYRPPAYTRYIPTPGDITECSRNDSEIESTEMSTTQSTTSSEVTLPFTTTEEIVYYDTDYLYYPYDYSGKKGLNLTTKSTTETTKNVKPTEPELDYPLAATDKFSPFTTTATIKPLPVAETTAPAILGVAGAPKDPEPPADSINKPSHPDTNEPSNYSKKYEERKLRKGKRMKLTKIPQQWTKVFYYAL